MIGLVLAAVIGRELVRRPPAWAGSPSRRTPAPLPGVRQTNGNGGGFMSISGSPAVIIGSAPPAQNGGGGGGGGRTVFVT